MLALLSLALTAARPGISFEPMNFIYNLGYMGRGMLVIFVIIGIIILTTLFVNRFFSRKS